MSVITFLNKLIISLAHLQKFDNNKIRLIHLECTYLSYYISYFGNYNKNTIRKIYIYIYIVLYTWELSKRIGRNVEERQHKCSTQSTVMISRPKCKYCTRSTVYSPKPHGFRDIFCAEFRPDKRRRFWLTETRLHGRSVVSRFHPSHRRHRHRRFCLAEGNRNSSKASERTKQAKKSVWASGPNRRRIEREREREQKPSSCPFFHPFLSSAFHPIPPPLPPS